MVAGFFYDLGRLGCFFLAASLAWSRTLAVGPGERIDYGKKNTDEGIFRDDREEPLVGDGFEHFFG